MNYTPLIQQALYRAARQHDGQTRKGIRYPYIVHPVSVAAMVAEDGGDETAICAALLHDVIEDTKGYSLEDMRRDFGDEISDLVTILSEDKSLAWCERKERYLERFESANKTALMIKAADTLHNLLSIENALADPTAILEDLSPQRARSGWYYARVTDLMKRRLPDSRLSAQLDEAWQRLNHLFA